MRLDNDTTRGLGIAAAIVACGMAAFHLNQCRANAPSDLFVVINGMAFRPTEPLLSGVGTNRPLRQGGALSDHQSVSELRLRAAAAEAIARGVDPHRAAVAHLLLSETAAAIDGLTAIAARSRDAEVFGDLSAALFMRAGELGDDGLIADALGAADRGLALDPKCRTAQFNRALALAQLGLTRDARRAWQRYLQLGPPAPQADEVLARLHALPASSASEEWQRLYAAALRLKEPARDSMLHELVRRFPQEARTTAEGLIMSNWADATLCGEAAAADKALQTARRISVHLRAVSGETLLADAIAAAERHEREKTAEILAVAHAIYRDARVDHSAHHAAEAEREFRAAIRLFERAGSPMAYVARYFLGSALHAQQRLRDATAVLEALEKEPLQSDQYYALAAMIGWERGACLLESGALTEAVDVFTRSRSAFLRLGELSYVAAMDAYIGGSLDRLGDTKAAWQARRRALTGFSRAGKQDSYLLTLDAAAASAMRHRKWDAADALLSLVITNAERGQRNAPVIAHAFAQRALIDVQRGDLHAAERNANASRLSTARLQDAAIRMRADADCAFIEAMIARSHDPHAALAGFDEALRHYKGAEQRVDMPRIYLERGRTARSLGRLADARRDFEAGIAVIEMERHHVRDLEQRASLMSAADEIFTEAIDAAMAADDSAAAFELSERDRARALTEMYALGYESSPAEIRPQSLAEIQNALASDAAIVEYQTLPDRLLIFVVRSDGLHATTIASRESERNAVLQRLRKAVRARSEDGLTAAAAAETLLLRPVRSALEGIHHLAFAADTRFSDVPFSTLYDPSTRRFLIEEVDIVTAPSATLLVQTSRGAGRTESSALLAVGANVFAFDRYSSLSPLEATGDEIARVTSMYPRSKRLVGAFATRGNVVAALPDFPAVHIAAHGLADVDVPARSTLLLAPTAPNDGGELRAAEIARLRMPRTKLVILASCDSAARTARRDGADNLALAFIAAGVPTVVASLWDLDDRDSVPMMTAFHRGVTAGRDPAAVLQEMVIADLHAHPVSLPHSSALVVIGGSRRLLGERKDQP